MYDSIPPDEDFGEMRGEVLRCYRNLYRTCQRVFQGDNATFNAAKIKLRDEFLKNSKVSDEARLYELVTHAEEAEKFLRERIVQVVQTGENTFRLKLTKDSVLEDNAKLPPKED